MPDFTSLYTPQEQAMYKAIGLEKAMSRCSNPTKFYTIAAKLCFVYNKQGPAVEELRRVMLGSTFTFTDVKLELSPQEGVIEQFYKETGGLDKEKLWDSMWPKLEFNNKTKIDEWFD